MHILSSFDDLTLSFDLGGSHIAAWYSKVPLAPQTAARVLLDPSSSKEAILDAISRAGRQALVLAGAAGEAVDSIAFATPGPLDYAVGTSQTPHKFGSILNYPLRPFLQKRFSAHPEHICFLNDANAFLLGQLISVSQVRTIGLTLGTGTDLPSRSTALSCRMVLAYHHPARSSAYHGTVELLRMLSRPAV